MRKTKKDKEIAAIREKLNWLLKGAWGADVSDSVLIENPYLDCLARFIEAVDSCWDTHSTGRRQFSDSKRIEFWLDLDAVAVSIYSLGGRVNKKIPALVSKKDATTN